MIFRKEFETTIQELEERILQLEKRLEEHRRINTKDFNYLDNGYLDNRNYLEELENRIQKLERKKKSDKSKKLSEEKKYEILEEWKIQQGSDKE